MRLELTGRHVTITPTLRKSVEKLLSHLTRMVSDRAISVQVVVTKEKTRYHVDMTLHARGDHFFHGAANGRDVPTALSAAAAKIENQALKLKSRWVKGRRQEVSTARAAAPPPERGNGSRADRESQPTRIIRARRYAVKPMSVDDAALEVGADRDAFLVFRNATTDTINVLFRRSDGNLGLIEPEA